VRSILSRDDTTKLLDMQDDSSLTEICLYYITLILEQTSGKDWEKCLSQVSWKHYRVAVQAPTLDFLDHACRFWPTPFLLVRRAGTKLKKSVVKFLLNPKVAGKWFELYLLSISQSTQSSSGDQKAPESEKASGAGDSYADSRQAALRMASFVGLSSIIPEILADTFCPPIEVMVMNMRRGYTERTVAFLGTRSKDYLDCAIANDDDGALRELLNSHPEVVASYFPLHKATIGGCVKIAEILFNQLDNPAKADTDGRTPLHQAAIGGSAKMIRLLLGKANLDG
jgi:hypothetical protein